MDILHIGNGNYVVYISESNYTNLNITEGISMLKCLENIDISDLDKHWLKDTKLVLCEYDQGMRMYIIKAKKS